jgi:hypothetical protein
LPNKDSHISRAASPEKLSSRHSVTSCGNRDSLRLGER